MKDIACLIEYNKIAQGQKVKISPSGEFVGVDGRKYFINAPEVIAHTRSLGVDLMLDKNHEDKEAMGWFDANTLEAREDGIYATLEFNSEGKALVDEKIYRYLSPAYVKGNVHNGVCEVKRIASVGLVNRPNVLNEALNNQQGGNMEEENKALKTIIEELKAQNEELKAQIKALSEANSTLEQNAIESKIQNAIKNGEMLPSRKESALALNKESLDSYLEVCKAEAQNILKNKSLTLDSPSGEEGIEESIRAQLGI